MICKNCGSQLDEESKFCGLCGAKVELEPVVDVKPETKVEAEPVVDVRPETKVEAEPVVDVRPETVEPIIDNSTNSGINNNIVSNVSNDVSSSNDFNNGSHKSGKKFLVVIVLLIIISLLLGGVYFYLNNKKRIVSGLINSLYSGVEDLYSDKGYDITKESLLMSGDITVNTNVQELSILNGEKIGYKLGFDYQNKKLEFGASLDENGSNIIDGNVYVLEDSTYLSIKDAFDGIISLDSYGFDEIFNYDFSNMNSNQDDIRYIVKAYKDILIDSLNMDDFKKSNDTITVDGKDVKVKKLSYELNDQRLNSLISNMCDGMLKDSKLLDILSKMSGVSVDSLKSSLEQTKTSNSSYLNGRSILFDIYTKGFDNSFVGMDIAGIIQIRKSGDAVNINAGVGAQSVNIVINKVSNDSYNISVSTNVTGKNIKVDLTISNNKVDNKNSNGSISLNVDYDGQSIGLTNKYNVSIGSKVADININGAKSVNEMSEEEFGEISNKIISKVSDSNIYQFINEISSTFRQTSNQESLYID